MGIGFGDILAPITGLVGGIINNKAQGDQSREQMNFQREMSNTAHTREVADLKRAGLNPMLSANAGASTPGGAMAQTQNVAEGFSSAVGQMMQLKQQNKLNEKNMEGTDAQIGLAKEQARKTRIEANSIKPESDIKNGLWNLVREAWSSGSKASNASVKKLLDSGFDPNVARDGGKQKSIPLRAK